jgi:4-diphosphocytidyl-2-C-methyl-D-erythritol kinase
MCQLRIKAHAKINLFLNVLYKRPDGYHEIETVFQSIGLSDDIILKKLAKDIKIICEHPQVPLDESNLAYRAAKLLFEASELSAGAEITIKKRIPISAGLGGGSADAAGVLVGLNQLFELGYEREQLMQLGATLGADVPFCLLGGTALGQGIGEILTPLPPIDGIWLVLANPGFMVSTAWVYQNLPVCTSNFDYDSSKNENLGLTKCPKHVNILIQQIRTGNWRQIYPEMFNALEVVVVNRYPVIGRLKHQLTEFGALGALMSGSGATVFAWMPDELHAKSAAGELSAETHFCLATTTSPVGVTIV